LPGSGMRRRGWGAHCSTHPNRQRRIRPVPQLRGQPAPEACTEQEPPLPCSLARTVDRAACYPGRPARIQGTNRNEDPKHYLRRRRHGEGFLAARPSRWLCSSFPAARRRAPARLSPARRSPGPPGVLRATGWWEPPVLLVSGAQPSRSLSSGARVRQPGKVAALPAGPSAPGRLSCRRSQA